MAVKKTARRKRCNASWAAGRGGAEWGGVGPSGVGWAHVQTNFNITKFPKGYCKTKQLLEAFRHFCISFSFTCGFIIGRARLTERVTTGPMHYSSSFQSNISWQEKSGPTVESNRRDTFHLLLPWDEWVYNIPR